MKLEDLMQLIERFVNRNRINYLAGCSPIMPNQVNLHWWEMGGTEQNVGDLLSPRHCRLYEKSATNL